jgi:hypothetical protein
MVIAKHSLDVPRFVPSFSPAAPRLPRP